VAAIADQQPVQALGAHRAYPALGIGVGLRRPRWDLHDLDARGGEHRVERGGELRVPVAEQVSEPVGPLAEVHQQVPGGLGDPLPGGVGGDAGQVRATAVELDDEQHVQPGQSDRLDGEEVTRKRAGGLGAQELGPSRSAAAGCRAEPVAVQQVAHRGRRHAHTELAAFAGDPDVAPTCILASQSQHQFDHLGIQAAPMLSAGVGPAAADQLAVPAQQVDVKRGLAT